MVINGILHTRNFSWKCSLYSDIDQAINCVETTKNYAQTRYVSSALIFLLVSCAYINRSVYKLDDQMYYYYNAYIILCIYLLLHYKNHIIILFHCYFTFMLKSCQKMLIFRIHENQIPERLFELFYRQRHQLL